VDEELPDPQEFPSERWLGGGPGAGGEFVRRVAMLRAGPRMCLGRRLAIAEIKTVMAMLLRASRQSVEGPGGAEARERLTLTMSPIGLRCAAQPTPLTMEQPPQSEPG
jgi:cytochrome P450